MVLESLKPGEKLGLDGELLSEAASFNTAALTGESKPDTKSKGETVLAGMINLNTVAQVKVTTAYTDSKLSKILELVQNATAQKAPTELFIRKFAKIYTPIVVLLAVPSSVMSGVFIETGLLHTTLFTGGAVLSEMLTYAVLQGVVIGIISTLLYSFAITNLGASRAALMGSVSPVLTTLGAIPLLGETPALGTVVCLVLVSAGVLTANLWGTAVPLTHTRSRLGARLRVKNAIV